MICDECGSETECMSLDWIAAATIQSDTYTTGTNTGSAVVTQTTYSGAEPLETHLCQSCFLPRARRCCRNWWLERAGFLGAALGLLAISYFIWFWTAFVPPSQLPGLPVWQIVVGIICGLGGLFLLKIFWDMLRWESLRWRPSAPDTARQVHNPYAVKKSNAGGRDEVFSPEHYKAMQRVAL